MVMHITSSADVGVLISETLNKPNCSIGLPICNVLGGYGLAINPVYSYFIYWCGPTFGTVQVIAISYLLSQRLLKCPICSFKL